MTRTSKVRVRPRVRILGCVAVALSLIAVAGCASKAPPPKSKVAPSEVKVYQTPDLLMSQYTLIEHVWIDSWRSNLTFPTFDKEADGMDEMKRVASDAGANALINAICIDGRSKPSDKPVLYCYSDAIRVN
ncbi:MAG TPA: hypothetical protein VML56_10175 [Burkholderiales bacterium]|nr:hypothetical protein [Burkholderiales bacterium]